MQNSYSFAAIRGIQAGRAIYVAMVPVRTLERLFSFDGEELPTALRAQRSLNKARIPAIARYVVDNPGEYVLSALSATIDGAFAFEPAVGQRSIGTLNVDMTATIVINDGQHRRAGLIEALRDRPSLGDETIAVTLFPDEGLERSQQMFLDLNQHGVRPARSLRLFYDGRDEDARLSRAVADAIPLLRDMTDFTRSSLAAGSRKLFAFSSIHTAVTTLVDAALLRATAEDPSTVVEFWEAVIANMPDWLAAGRREVAPTDSGATPSTRTASRSRRSLWRARDCSRTAPKTGERRCGDSPRRLGAIEHPALGGARTGKRTHQPLARQRAADRGADFSRPRTGKR